MTIITERVAAGAAFLDEHDPEWWREIDLGALDLADSRLCVLGQRCPLETLAGWNSVPVSELTKDDDTQRYYAFGYALMSAAGDPRPLLEWARERGFTSTLGQWAALTAEWKRVITERRAA